MSSWQHQRNFGSKRDSCARPTTPSTPLGARPPSCGTRVHLLRLSVRYELRRAAVLSVRREVVHQALQEGVGRHRLRVTHQAAVPPGPGDGGGREGARGVSKCRSSGVRVWGSNTRAVGAYASYCRTPGSSATGPRKEVYGMGNKGVACGSNLIQPSACVPAAHQAAMTPGHGDGRVRVVLRK